MKRIFVFLIPIGIAMSILLLQEETLNIRYDAPEELWTKKIPLIYSQMPGWLGYTNGMPYWFGYDDGNETTKYISASVEIGGLQFYANMMTDEWLLWIGNFKKIATIELGFEVGDVRDGYQ